MKLKTIILYRVVQEWRAPVFERLSKDESLDLEVWYGPDFKGTKIVSTKKDYSFTKRKLLSFKIKLASKNGIIAMPFSPLLFFKLILKNPNVVICEGGSNIINSFIAFCYCKIFRKKYIWWSLGKLQNRQYDIKRSKIDKLIQFIELKSESIITYSTVGKKYFESIGVNKEKIFKAVNVVDTERILNSLNKYNDKHSLINNYEKFEFKTLFVGALIQEKSIDLLLKAQKIIEQKYPNAGLIIVGDGAYRNQLEDMSKNLELKNVDFAGKRVDDNYKYFSIADLFVLPGLGGLAISEAMCYGLPIITSIGDGCEVDLVTNKNGIIDIEITPERLAQHIIFFIENRNTATEFGAESINIIQNKFNIYTYIKEIKNAIHS